MAKKNNNVTRLPAPQTLELPIPVGFLDKLRKLREQGQVATRKLGQLRASYVVQERHLLREIEGAEQSLAAAGKSALLAAGQDPDGDGTWDLDLRAGTFKKG